MSVQEPGLVAVLDALGASRYTDEEIDQFLESRTRVIALIKDRSETLRGLVPSNLSTFTFADTVVIAYRLKGSPLALEVVHDFCVLLRQFETNSLEHGILFRGAISVGTFLVDEASNTVMGKAVTDAASWYARADWIGVMATPHATMIIQSLLEGKGDKLAAVLVDYPVPLKGGGSLMLKAVNWPKAFYVGGVRPRVIPDKGAHERGTCLALLAKQGVPKGDESKHVNSMAFFDHCIKRWRAERKAKGK
jgi:hypothetical protein